MQRSKSVKLTVLSKLAAAMLLISGQCSTDTTLHAQKGYGHSKSRHVTLRTSRAFCCQSACISWATTKCTGCMLYRRSSVCLPVVMVAASPELPGCEAATCFLLCLQKRACLVKADQAGCSICSLKHRPYVDMPCRLQSGKLHKLHDKSDCFVDMQRVLIALSAELTAATQVCLCSTALHLAMHTYSLFYAQLH